LAYLGAWDVAEIGVALAAEKALSDEVNALKREVAAKSGRPAIT
jgi:hypothetical protein